MTITVLPIAKDFNTQYPTRLRFFRKTKKLKSGRPPIEECFASLEAKSEVKKKGLEFVKNAGIPKKELKKYTCFFDLLLDKLELFMSLQKRFTTDQARYFTITPFLILQKPLYAYEIQTQ